MHETESTPQMPNERVVNERLSFLPGRTLDHLDELRKQGNALFSRENMIRKIIDEKWGAQPAEGRDEDEGGFGPLSDALRNVTLSAAPRDGVRYVPHAVLHADGSMDSIVSAGGWCAPSETFYNHDLNALATGYDPSADIEDDEEDTSSRADMHRALDRMFQISDGMVQVTVTSTARSGLELKMEMRG